jgi:nucleotide-binding universal stress UspA family protein
MFKKILIPLDGSGLSARAVPVAYALAGPDTELILVRAIDPVRIALGISAYGVGSPWLDELSQPRRQAADQLALVRASLPADLGVDSYVTEGEAAATIVDTARDTTTDLIVMSSHGYSGLSRWMLGSVTERVIRAAPCPVLVVRGRQRYDHILVTLDGSPLSEQALAPALAVATAFHAEVTMLRAIEPQTLTAAEVKQLDELEPGLGQGLIDAQISEAEDYLRRMAAASGLPRGAFKVVIPATNAAEAIVFYAETHPVDLIAMVTHGRSGLQRWTLGSVTEKVLRATECSILVIRPQRTDGQAPA